MHFDFAAILVIATFLTGIIWAVDSLLFAPRRRLALAQSGEAESVPEDSTQRPGEPVIVEYARSFFPVILIVLLIRSFLVEPFRIPSSSMVPNLLIGDLILVNKFTYGLRLPVLNTKFIELSEPERGDVVVFRYPKDPSLDYIKRVVGLPGDEIEFHGKTLIINGSPVASDVIGPYNKSDGNQVLRGWELGVEYLPEKEHEILLNPAVSSSRYQGRKWVVPEGHYFVMGDNRDNSEDSRRWGFVPEENLVGKAFLIWMHLSPSGWNRIGSGIN